MKVLRTFNRLIQNTKEHNTVRLLSFAYSDVEKFKSELKTSYWLNWKRLMSDLFEGGERTKEAVAYAMTFLPAKRVVKEFVCGQTEWWRKGIDIESLALDWTKISKKERQELVYTLSANMVREYKKNEVLRAVRWLEGMNALHEVIRNPNNLSEKITPMMLLINRAEQAHRAIAGGDTGKDAAQAALDYLRATKEKKMLEANYADEQQQRVRPRVL
jgi:hypothetical protein